MMTTIIRISFTVIMILSFFAAGYCQNFRYEPHGRRDPFIPLIGQDKAQSAGLSDVTSIEDVRLEGIAMGATGGRTAILNGEIVREGFKSGDIEIKTISSKSVSLLINGKEFNVKLPEEGGLRSE